MQKMSIDLSDVRLCGPVMGTHWSADLGLPAGIDPADVEAALGAAVAQVDAQMSTWKHDSDLMQFNAAPVGDWQDIPPELMHVMMRGLEIGRASEGAFDIGLGDLVSAWGFGADRPDESKIRANLGRPRRPAHELLELDENGLRARKLGLISLDLSGIAKGFAVDEMIRVCDDFGISSALVALDGELRSKGVQPDGKPWTVTIEKPAYEARLPLSMLELENAAVATSGDYRHWIEIGQTRVAHTMDRKMGGPVQPGIASVTVVADACITADAMATAILILGKEKGREFARAKGVACLILERTPTGFETYTAGALFQS